MQVSYSTSHSVYSCSRHGQATARLTSERPGNVTPVPKTFTLLAVRSLSHCELRHFICLLSFTLLFVRIF